MCRDSFCSINDTKREKRPVKNFVRSRGREIGVLRLVTTTGTGESREKTKDDDSKVGGEKNLVDDTRFLRRWVLRHCLFLLSASHVFSFSLSLSRERARCRRLWF